MIDSKLASFCITRSAGRPSDRQMGKINTILGSPSYISSVLKSAKVGEKVAMEVEVIKAGKTLAFTKANVFNEEGEILAQGNNIISLRESKSLQEFYENLLK